MGLAHSISKPNWLSWINLEALYDETDWQHKAQALQERRWRIIRHNLDTKRQQPA